METTFVGRLNEQREFTDWVATEPTDPDFGRAALLTGSAGMGKSSLLRRCERLCIVHAPERWYVQTASLNANETPSAFLERLLHDTHRLFTRKYLTQGPRDRR